jgi:hypothetical protein
MHSVSYDSQVGDDIRRQRLYEGHLFVYSPTPASLAFVDFARDLLKQAFGPLDPELAQFHMPVEQYAAVLAELKPRFIHHPKSKECIRGILKELGCDLNETYFDVPRMRSATSENYLTSGIAYAFHPHRDTWYSAPFCQLNFWIPVYAIQTENAMAFHPHYWSRAVRNGSSEYNYAEWNATSRQTAAQHIKTDTRKQPRAEEPMELEPQVILLPPPGGIILFSAAQMHSTVPNTAGRTRFSIDFRTVNLRDAQQGRGAANVDSACTGTTMGDYLRGTDLAHLPEKLIHSYDLPPHASSEIPQQAQASGGATQ